MLSISIIFFIRNRSVVCSALDALIPCTKFLFLYLFLSSFLNIFSCHSYLNMSTCTVKIRINWNTKVESYSQPYQGKGGAPVKDAEDGDDNMNVDQNSGNVIKNDEEIENEDEEGEDEEEEEEVQGDYTLQQMQLHAAMVSDGNNAGEDGVVDNSCQLLWQGIQAKRTFMGFKFQVN